MKIGGRTINGPKQDFIVLPRADGDIVFKFVGLANTDAYDKINPEPQAPRTYKPALGKTIENIEDPAYKAKYLAWLQQRNDWVFLKSIEPSDIQWDTVDLSDASTWVNWRKDLENAGFSMGERNVIWNKFIEITSLTDEILKEARDRFLLSQSLETLSQTLSSTAAPENTSSGEPVNASESTLPV